MVIILVHQTITCHRQVQVYNIFVGPQNFGGTIWLADVAIIPPVLDFLTANHIALLITPLETSLAHPPRDFKGLAFSRIHSNS